MILSSNLYYIIPRFNSRRYKCNIFISIKFSRMRIRRLEKVLNYLPPPRISFIHLPNFRNDQQITAIFYRCLITSAVLSYVSLNCSNALGIQLCSVSRSPYPVPKNPRKIFYKSSTSRIIARRRYFRFITHLYFNST